MININITNTIIATLTRIISIITSTLIIAMIFLAVNLIQLPFFLPTHSLYFAEHTQLASSQMSKSKKNDQHCLDLSTKL